MEWCPATKDCLQWTPTVTATTYRVYRGVASGFSALADPGVDSCSIGSFFSNTTGHGLTAGPPAGDLYWYLVTATNGAGEGSAGAATSGARMVNASGSCELPCDSFDDCPVSQSCNLTSGLCEAACGAGHSVCNGGCCNGTSCESGLSNATCGGSGGACVTCVNATPTCEQGACTSTCGAAGNGTCGGGNCCSNGTCVTGNATTTCGAAGVCADCTQSPSGRTCLVGTGLGSGCGCISSASECPAANPAAGTPGKACDRSGHTCTSICNVEGFIGLCNGGCCSTSSPQQQGQCVVGTSSFSCGSTGGFCNSCFNTCNQGTLCLGGACGCTLTGGCTSPVCVNRQSCAVDSGVCCVGTGGPCTTAGQCCSGICGVGGTCTCIPSGSSCRGNPALCCSNTCVGGVCS